nr:unnamed protein product [Spirometra erinaceieuropaei]
MHIDFANASFICQIAGLSEVSRHMFIYHDIPMRISVIVRRFRRRPHLRIYSGIVFPQYISCYDEFNYSLWLPEEVEINLLSVLGSALMSGFPVQCVI